MGFKKMCVSLKDAVNYYVYTTYWIIYQIWGGCGVIKKEYFDTGLFSSHFSRMDSSH